MSENTLILSNFKSNVIEVLDEKKIPIKDFCEMCGFGKNMVYDLDKHLPKIDNAAKIADSLNVPLDFLVGRTDICENLARKSDLSCFVPNIEKVLKELKISKNKFYKDLNFSNNRLSCWNKGVIPYLDTVIKIADYLKVSVDYLIGRSDA